MIWIYYDPSEQARSGSVSSDRSVAARFRGLTDRNGEHRTHSAAHILDVPRCARLRLVVCGSALVVRGMSTGINGLVRRDGQHLAHEVRTSANPLRQRPSLLLMMISIVGMATSSVGACIDSFLLGDRYKLPGCVCDGLHRCRMRLMGCMVFLPIRVRVIDIEGIIRGDREHLAQMADADADSISDGFRVVFSGGHVIYDQIRLWRLHIQQQS